MVLDMGLQPNLAFRAVAQNFARPAGGTLRVLDRNLDAMEAMRSGIAGGRRFDRAGVAALIPSAFAPSTGGTGKGTLWTNRYAPSG